MSEKALYVLYPEQNNVPQLLRDLQTRGITFFEVSGKVFITLNANQTLQSISAITGEVPEVATESDFPQGFQLTPQPSAR